MNLINTKLLNLKNLNRNHKFLLLLLSDLFSAFICWLIFGPPMATAIASEFSEGVLQIAYSQWFNFILPISLSLFYLYIFGFYRSLIKFFDSKDSIFLCITGSLVFGFSWTTLHIYQFQSIATSFLSIALLQGFLLSAIFYAFLNLSRDTAKYLLYPSNTNKDARPIIIYGAGVSGNQLYQSLAKDPSKKIVAFFDNSQNLKEQWIHNIPIIGSFNKIEKFKQLYPSLEVLLAIPSLDTEQRRKIISKLEKIRVAVRTVPSFTDILSDEKKMSDIQNLSLDDLLPRARVIKGVVSDTSSKNFLVSGAGGSIGSEIAKQLLEHNPKSIILFEISELNLFVIERECQAIKASKKLSTKIIPILGDIRDRNNLTYVFTKFSINHVYHAAAYKHVPLVEDENNIVKAAENNILGTFNLADISIKHNIESFVMISTDKAVRPSNVMGASKRMAEMLIQSMNSLQSSTKLSMVRFGNVINSSGSVIPLFLEQISKGGPLTVTHKEVTRYFMTIPEASNLVLQAAEMSTGGEVFILDMGEQLRVYDLAKKLIHLSGRNISSEPGSDGIEIIEIGLRPGEKMYEELLISGDQLPTDNSKIFMSKELFPDQDVMKKLIDDIKYAISKNDTKGIKDIFKRNVEGYDNENK